jgi:hypothetical protein
MVGVCALPQAVRGPAAGRGNDHCRAHHLDWLAQEHELLEGGMSRQVGGMLQVSVFCKI